LLEPHRFFLFLIVANRSGVGACCPPGRWHPLHNNSQFVGSVDEPPFDRGTSSLTWARCGSHGQQSSVTCRPQRWHLLFSRRNTIARHWRRESVRANVFRFLTALRRSGLGKRGLKIVVVALR
jgi:hypothetical protein